MSINLEIESKVMITKVAYKQLLKIFKNEQTYKQTNFYISSLELDKKRDLYGLRIRQKGNNYELTLKVTETIGKTEINQEISKKSLQNLKHFSVFPEGEVKDYLHNHMVCNPADLHIIGSLKTYRTDINFLDSLISIDKSKYNGITDYEIECESDSLEIANSTIKQFCEQNNVKYKKSELSKLARFYNSRK